MNERISVAMVTRDYPPRTGGIPTHVYSLASALRKLGVRVDVFVGGTDLRTTMVPILGDLSKYDIVHVQSAPYGSLVNHHPFAITVHSPVLEEGRYYTFKNLLKLPFAYLSERVGLARADGIIAVSEISKRILTRRYSIDDESIAVIPNGVELHRFTLSKSSEATARVLICSRLDKRKNIDEALIALSELRNSKYELRVIGNGVERERLEDMAGELRINADFVGEVHGDELSESFSRSDIFVSTSYSEGFGIAVLEAMAAGCAVLASDIPAHREIITHMENGLLYSTSEELLTFLKRLLQDREFVRKLGLNARSRAGEYSWDKVALDTYELYKRLLKSRHPRRKVSQVERVL